MKFHLVLCAGFGFGLGLGFGLLLLLQHLLLLLLLLWTIGWRYLITLATGARFALRLVLLLPFHASILEPDLDLTFGQTERMRNLYASSARQITVEMELLLQLQRLIACIGLAATFALCWFQDDQRYPKKYTIKLRRREKFTIKINA